MDWTECPIVVGRAAEIARFDGVVRRLADGAGGVVVLCGDAGIGKSRLAREFLSRAAAPADRTLVGGCIDEAAPAPYGLIADALRRFRQGGPRPGFAAARASDLLDRLSPAAQEPATPPDPAEVADALISMVLDDGACASAIILLEDLHWADPSSITTARHLVHRLPSAPVVLIMTWRDPPKHRASNLTSIISDIASAPARRLRVQLGPLTWAETRQMTQALLGLERLPPTAFTDELYSRAEGNPFFTEELVRHATAQPGEHEPVLRLGPELPASVQDLILARIALLPRFTRNVLGVAAVAGRRFQPALLAHLVGRPAEEVLGAIRDAVRTNLVFEGEPAGTFAFRHSLLQEAASSMLLENERTQLHARIARALEASRADGMVVQPAELAEHCARAGLVADERIYAEEAAEVARRQARTREAARWYRRTLALAHELDEDVPDSLLARAAAAFVLAGRLDDADEVYQGLIAKFEGAGDIAGAADTMTRSASALIYRPRRRRRRLERAIELLVPRGDMRALARAEAAYAAFLLAALDERRLQVAVTALGRARTSGAEDAEVIALRCIGSTLKFHDAALGERLLLEAVRLAGTRGLPFEGYQANGDLANLYARAGLWQDAEAAIRRGLDLIHAQSDSNLSGALLARLAALTCSRGDWRAADATIEGAWLTVDASDLSAVTLLTLSRAQLHALRGRWDAVTAALEPIQPALERSGRSFYRAEAAYLLARAAHARNDRDRAIGQLDRLLEPSNGRGDDDVIAEMLVFGWELYRASGRAGDAQRCLDILRGVKPDPAPPPGVQSALIDFGLELPFDADKGHLLAPDVDATIDLGKEGSLAAAEARIAQAEGRLDAAIELWQRAAELRSAVGHPYEQAVAHMGLAHALLERNAGGDRAAGREQLFQARAIFERLGAPELGAVDATLRRRRLVSTRGAPTTELSAREREIADLVAAGMSNREIAEALVLAPKTVEHHVSRMLARLQLPGRAAIAAYVVSRAVLARTTDNSSAD